MGFAERMKGDLDLIRSEEFRDLCRRSPKDFTRRRKMPHDGLVESLLARKGRSLSIELRDVRASTGVRVTKAGYLKARMKLRPEALLAVAQRHAAAVYADGCGVTLCGMVVVAIDGSTCDVPTNGETIALYGNASAPDSRPQATIGVSSAYDPLTGQILNVTLCRGSFDERAEVMGHLLVATRVTGGKPLLAVMDRGYPSLLMIARLECAGVSYLMRCQGRFLSQEFRAAEAAGGDLWIDVRLTAKKLRRTRDKDPAAAEALRQLGSIRIRFCIVDIGGDSPEYLVTNVGEEVLPHDRLREVYWDRWPVETCFEYMKDRLQMENFTGTKPALIEQDCYATAYLANLAFDLAREADAEASERIESEGKRYKHKMVANRSFAIGALKQDLYMMILAGDDERVGMAAALVEDVSHELVPVRPGRPAYSREGLSVPRAGRYSNTHKRVF